MSDRYEEAVHISIPVNKLWLEIQKRWQEEQAESERRRNNVGKQM